MTAVWQTRLAESTLRARQASGTAYLYLSRPEIFHRLQRGLFVLLAVWCLWSIWRAAWSFLPAPAAIPAASVMNPIADGAAAVGSTQIDIEALVAANLFGEPGEEPAPELAQAGAAAEDEAGPMTEERAAQELAGIEEGAEETRLPLVLRGVVASSEAGLGQAIIEHRKEQDLYLVGDDLPVNRKVVLAKVMPTQVVLDNEGRYELLKLFEDSAVATEVAASRPVPASAPRRTQTEAPSRPVEALDTEEAANLAAQYRDRLYSDPQSLADVVRVTAVRQDGALLGYRIAPGKAGEAFRSLGFKAGDLVTAVNGMSLTDPSNTVRLYQAMRSADQAVFEMERQGEPLTLSVSIAEATGGAGR